MGKKRRRTFTPEQKSEAVKIVRQSGKSINQVATEMGLTTSSLRNWVNQAEIDQRGTSDGPLTSEERNELVQLRKELKRVQQERDFLKKAAAFFARESS